MVSQDSVLGSTHYNHPNHHLNSTTVLLNPDYPYRDLPIEMCAYSIKFISGIKNPITNGDSVVALEIF